MSKVLNSCLIFYFFGKKKLKLVYLKKIKVILFIKKIEAKKKKSKTFFKQFSKAHLKIIFMRSNGQRLRYYRGDIVENYSKVGKS